MIMHDIMAELFATIPDAGVTVPEKDPRPPNEAERALIERTIDFIGTVTGYAKEATALRKHLKNGKIRVQLWGNDDGKYALTTPINGIITIYRFDYEQGFDATLIHELRHVTDGVMGSFHQNVGNTWLSEPWRYFTRDDAPTQSVDKPATGGYMAEEPYVRGRNEEFYPAVKNVTPNISKKEWEAIKAEGRALTGPAPFPLK
jgi:hypothetical protein